MKKIILLFILIFGSMICKAQFSYEHYYPEKVFISKFENAPDLSSKIDAAGELAIFHMTYCRDSLRDVYIKKAYDLASAGEDAAYMVKAKFWDTYVHSISISFDETQYVTRAANDLLSYAEKYNFPEYRIAAYNMLSFINIINDNLTEAEKSAITASLWLEDIKDDSLRLEVYYSLANVFICKKDGINASRYLLKLKEYTEQDDNEVNRVHAIRELGFHYFIMGDYLKATAYDKQLYRYFAKKKDIYGQVGIIGELTMCAMSTNDNEMKKYYSDRFIKLQDSLNIVNYQTYWIYYFRYANNMITAKNWISLLKGHFGNRYFWPKARENYDLGKAYLDVGKLDSAEYYFNLAKINGVEKLAKGNVDFQMALGYLQYYKRDYTEALKIFTDEKANARKNNSVIKYIGCLQWTRLCYEAMKDYKNANAEFYEYNKINDSIEKLNNKQVITMMEVEKDKEINDHKLKESEVKMEHSHNIQYMGMALGALAIILVLILLGIINARPWIIRAMSFFSFIFIFEFIILILDNQIHELTHGEPWKIMMIKVVVIGLLLPFHHFVEKQVAHNLIHKNLSPGKWIKTIWSDRIHKPEE